MTFSERLKKLRSKNGYTQQQVADILKVGRATIAGYETKDMYPDYDKLLMLADLFKCSVDYLLGRTEIEHFFTDAEFILTEKVLQLLKSEEIIPADCAVTQEKEKFILEELSTAVMAIKLLRKIKVSK